MRRLLCLLAAVLLLCAPVRGATDADAEAEAEPTAALKPQPVDLAGRASFTLQGQALYVLDREGRQSAAQVEGDAGALVWRERRRDNQRGFGDGALWVVFEAAAPPGERWYLEVATAIQDRIQLFHRNPASQWVVQDAGTEVPVAEWSVPGRLPTFRLAPAEAGTVRYWLRVQDDAGEFVAPLTLLREDVLQAGREREQFVFGGYFGLLALVAIASAVNGIAFRDKAFLSFALFILLLAVGQLTRAGVGAQHLWPERPVWNGTLLALWPGAATAAALWFVKVLTEPVRLSRALDLGVWALIAALLAATALNVAIGSRASMTLVLWLAAPALLAILAMALWGWLDARDRHLGLVVFATVPLLLLALFPLARSFNLMETNLLTRFGLFFGISVALPILYHALNLRLIARREGEMRASALSRTDALTGLPHRQALVDRLHASLAHARGQKQNCALLGVRISNLDSIADEFGRDALDKSLVIAASHLRRVIVGFDMAARVGEREFAVLLEAPVAPQAASSRAQQVVASGLRQMEALPAALTLKFHVTVAMLPDPQMDGEASLRWVIEGLDQFPADTRKLIRPLNF